MMPTRFWGDPSNRVDEINRYEKREAAGCSACRYKGDHLAFGFYECGVGEKAGRRGFCPKWKEALNA